MEKNRFSRWKFYLIFIIFSLLLSISPTAYVMAEILGPGWFMETAEPVSPEEAEAYYASRRKEIEALKAGITAATIMPEIQELARGLQYDPKLIYNYVHNNIDYVPYFGSLKGATLTYLDGSGNDFDQASLMIMLLRESGYTAQYVYGRMTIPNYGSADNHDIQNWLGIDANTSVIQRVFGSGGIPSSTSGTRTTMDRVWVKATIDSTDYVFDPTFKIYEETAKIDLSTIIGYDKNELLTVAGGEVGADYVRNMNDNGLRTKLVEYATNMVAFLRANYPNASMDEIIGGRKIIPEYLDEYSTSLMFSNIVVETWDEIPDTYIHTIRIQHGQIDTILSIPEIAGNRLSLTYVTASGSASSNSASSIPEPLMFDAQQRPLSPLVPQTISEQVLSLPEREDDGGVSTQAFQGTVDFGRITNTSSVTWSITLSNPGSNPTLNVTSSLSDNSSGAYSIISGGGTLTIAPGGSLNIVVQFSGSGQSRGTKTATFTIDRWYSGYPHQIDTWNMTGFVVENPDLSSCYGINFGQRYLNDPVEATAILKNSGSLTLTINSISLAGTDSARFQITSGGSSGNLSAGAARNITVNYLADNIGVHDASILVDFSYDGISGYNINLPLSGETISAPAAQLWLEDTLIAQESSPVSGADLSSMTLSIDHPYSANGGTYADQTSTYKLTRGSFYVIISDFGGSKAGKLLKSRQHKLDAYGADGLPDTSREVLTETLNVMGQTWMRQTTLSDNLLAQIADVIKIRHHRFGIMAQESGYYVDVKTQLGSYISRRNDSIEEDAAFKAGSFLGSALEHGVLEQLQGVNRPAVSTIKLMYLANARGDKIFSVDASNYSIIEPQLTGYSSSDLQDFQTMVNNGAILILPANGQIVLMEWSGKGYVKFQDQSGLKEIGMIIGGDYYGGYGGLQVNADTIRVKNDYKLELKPEAAKPVFKTKDPVDLFSGVYLYDREDLSIGAAEPNGLRFRRSYNSTNNNQKSVLGYGWTHNYDINVNIHSDVQAGLGMRQPVDAAALIVSSIVSLDLMKASESSVIEWVVGALSSKWAMDELFENAGTIQLSSKALTFILLPDGSFNSPPGVTTKLVKQGSLFRLEERFGTRIDFNTDNKISSWQDVDSNTMAFSYNTDKLETVTDSVGRSLTLTYTGEFLTSVSDSAGRSVSYSYTTNDLTGYTDPEGKVWGYGYDTSHRMTSLSDPQGITTATNTYDSLGRVDTQTVPRQGGSTVTYNFYFSGLRNIEQDPYGNQTIYYFDHDGLNKGVEDALGNKSTKKHDGQDHIIQTIDPGGNSTIFNYDGNNNLTNTNNALTYETINTYDTQFRLTDITDPLNHTTHFDYDSEHHLIQTTDAETNQTGGTYYPNGQTETTTDGRGTVTIYTYDSYGNPLATATGSHSPVNYTFDSIGRMISLTDNEGSTTTFDYDNRGLLTRTTDPLDRTTAYIYDDTGRMTSRKDRKDDTILYSYTPSGKLETVTYPDSSTVNFTYNLHDNLTAMQDAVGTTSYSYDAANRLSSFTDPHGFVISYNYDEAGNLTTLTYPGSKTVTYTYDELNRLKTVTNWLTQTAYYTYDAAGRLINVTNFNGTVTDYDYDDADRLTLLENRKSDSSPIATYNFTLDGNGNRTQIIQDEPFLPAVTTESVDYAYNVKKNRLLTAGTSTFSYDNEGQLSDKDGTPYAFDYEHRLVSIGGANPSQFVYDGKGSRLKATRNSVTTRYIYDAGGNLLGETDGSNVITRYYIHGLGLMAMVTSSDEVYTYHFNPVGSTIAMTDSVENIVNMYAYTPFGEITAQAENVQQPFKFVGQYGVMTGPNGFYYMRARYYDPEVGRFVTEDPIGFDGGDVNLYVYVGNNPVLLNDPNGLIAPLVAFAIGKGLAVGISYTGVKIAQWTTNYMAGRNAVSNEVVNDIFKTVVAINAAEVGAMAVATGGYAAGRAVTTTVLANPSIVQKATDFIVSASSPGPPQPSGAGYLGGGIRAAYDYK